jgi:hypothetical protein
MFFSLQNADFGSDAAMAFECCNPELAYAEAKVRAADAGWASWLLYLVHSNELREFCGSSAGWRLGQMSNAPETQSKQPRAC